MRGAFLLSLGAAGALIMGAEAARAAQAVQGALDWSYAVAGVGTETATAFGNLPPVVLDRHVVAGVDLNASTSASDARWGSSQAWADTDGGPVPALHAGAWGAPTTCCGLPATFSTV